MFWPGWLIMSVAASDFSLLSDRALHDNPLVAGKLVHVRLGEVEALHVSSGASHRIF